MSLQHFFKSVFGLLIIFFICSCNTDDEGSITGKLTHAPEQTIYLQQITDSSEVSLDSAKTDAAGNFILKNPVTKLDFYVLKVNQSNSIFLALHGGEKVIVNGDANNLEKTYSVKGSKDSELLRLLRSYDQSLSDSLNKIYIELRDQNPAMKDSIGVQLQRFYTTTMEEFARNFIRQNMNSIVSLSATRFLNQQHELELMENLQKKLTKEYPDNKYVNDYNILITELKRLPAGAEAPEIILNTPEGTQRSLSSLKGKIVLIDFWASWCAPCRAENPALVKLYRKISHDTFEIFAVSLDDNLQSWKAAIDKDGLSWVHVSELKKWNSTVVKAYGIEAIPYLVLIDEKGKIISKGLRVDELDLAISKAINNI